MIQIEYDMRIKSLTAIASLSQCDIVISERLDDQTKKLLLPLPVSDQIALFGWEAGSKYKLGHTITCKMCHRSVGIWKYNQRSNSSKFDPMKEHRWFCPWICPTIRNGDTKSSVRLSLRFSIKKIINFVHFYFF